MSNEDTMKGIDSALEDVRKAYRLLWLYQRRVFDICQEIGRQFEASFYYTNYYGGRPTFDPLKDWVWRMLPMSQINFLYCKHADASMYPSNGDWTNFPRKGDCLIDLFVVSDTGLTDYSGKGEPDPTKFLPVKECKSQLGLYIFVNDQDRNESINWYYRIWQPSKYPDHNTSKSHDTIEGIRLYGYIFNLNEMYNKDTITKCIELFKENVKRNLGVNL